MSWLNNETFSDEYSKLYTAHAELKTKYENLLKEYISMRAKQVSFIHELTKVVGILDIK